MPNWCYNEITIDGFRLDLKNFANKAAANDPDKNDSLLQAFIPMPEEYRTPEGYNNGGYDWANNNWGTKWAESSIQMSGENFGDTGQITYSFDSPWHPPITGYDKISEMFPELTFIHFWDEPNLQFCGIRVTKAGEEIMMEEVDDNDYPNLSLDTPEQEQQYYEECDTVKNSLLLAANVAILELSQK